MCIFFKKLSPYKHIILCGHKSNSNKIFSTKYKYYKYSRYNHFYSPINHDNNRIQIRTLVARNFERPVLKEI